jgi:DNA replication initiation complex subunit (GINS family)
LDNPETNAENPEIKRVRDYLYKIVYDNFFDEKIENLSEEEKEYYKKIENFFMTKYN